VKSCGACGAADLVPFWEAGATAKLVLESSGLCCDGRKDPPKRELGRGTLLSIRDYIKLAAPEPEVLRVIGEGSERNGTSTLTSRQIDRIIKTSRSRKSKR
jgi:hypothetical protein